MKNLYKNLSQNASLFFGLPSRLVFENHTPEADFKPKHELLTPQTTIVMTQSEIDKIDPKTAAIREFVKKLIASTKRGKMREKEGVSADAFGPTTVEPEGGIAIGKTEMSGPVEGVSTGAFGPTTELPEGGIAMGENGTDLEQAQKLVGTPEELNNKTETSRLEQEGTTSGSGNLELEGGQAL